MIEKFLRVWYRDKEWLEGELCKDFPKNYKALFILLCSMLERSGESQEACGYNWPDPERVVVVDHGDYQGTLLFLVASQGYQPDKYWATKVSYGSCSGCDLFESVRDSNWNTEKPTPEQVKGYMTLCLHMLQGMKEI